MNVQYNFVNIIYINTCFVNTILFMITQQCRMTESEAVALTKKYKFSN